VVVRPDRGDLISPREQTRLADSCWIARSLSEDSRFGGASVLQDYRDMTDAQHEAMEKQTLFTIVHVLQQYSKEAKNHLRHSAR